MSEFYMIEAEEAFVEDISDITQRIESLVKAVTEELLKNHMKDVEAATPTECKNFDERFQWLQEPFPVITYSEAINILKSHSDKFSTPVDETQGLSKENELFLVKHIGKPVFVVNWPKLLKSFYMRRCKDNSDLVSIISTCNSTKCI